MQQYNAKENPARIRRRLIVIDDDSVVRTLLCDYFVAAGHTVTVYGAATDVTFMNLAAADAVITDFSMPYTNGGEFAQLVVSMLAQPPPVIIMSGNSESDIGGGGYPYDAYFLKPFERKDMLACIDELTAGRDEE